METDKKPSELSTQLFDMTKSFANMSRTGQLYGRLSMIKDIPYPNTSVSESIST